MRVADVATPKQEPFLWDGGAPGFGLRITAGGAKAFVFEGRHEGRTPRITIGYAWSWAIDEGRAEARRLQTMLDRGTDPRRGKAEKAQGEREAAEAAHRATPAAGALTPCVEDWRPCSGERDHRDHVNLARPGGAPSKRGGKPTTVGPLSPCWPAPWTCCTCGIPSWKSGSWSKPVSRSRRPQGRAWWPRGGRERLPVRALGAATHWLDHRRTGPVRGGPWPPEFLGDRRVTRRARGPLRGPWRPCRGWPQAGLPPRRSARPARRHPRKARLLDSPRRRPPLLRRPRHGA